MHGGLAFGSTHPSRRTQAPTPLSLPVVPGLARSTFLRDVPVSLVGGLQGGEWDYPSSYLIQIRPVLQDPRDGGEEGARALPGTRGLFSP